MEKMALLGNSLLEGTVLFVSSLLLLVWLYFRYKFSYWQRRGVPHSKPTMIFGSYKDCVLQKECVGQFMKRMYNEGVGNHFFGCYIFTSDYSADGVLMCCQVCAKEVKCEKKFQHE
ncbi:cytochrome P450 6j1-like isoform X1 [Cryptotermes secundus]|uniref:cytochrome P450 6j1-like isoform X1 n=1 Tax=Cryptotermes secundus TaxID=105785 RepID=UPI000CD7C299|nr:cytochrome P450 6j1-like isoform X1 [Cryptotermes secundus]